MFNTLRLFVAVPLPQTLKDYLVKTRQAYDVPGIRAVPEQNLHLTLFFLGNEPAAQLDVILEQLQNIARLHNPFTLTLEQLEPGPKRSAPRLVWARFQPHAAFEKLSLEVAKAFANNPAGHDKFIPHITLSRIKKEDRSMKDLPIIEPKEIVEFQVESLALWQSTLASPHPVYTIVKEFNLGN
ncbi:RNA 2',3'-cyclic phosphodiesterase [Nibribacter koreensis]|uniref:RNA 2',3'-cyclic phosphodiesterase n=1 Tax=Nibribacter koreensis TaxID=1084519 RepID=A0ABP8FA11_9BACT